MFPNSFLAPPPKSQKATVEDAEDEDVAAARKKKKKKKSKKKKTETSEILPQSVESTKPMLAQTSTAPTVLASPTKVAPVIPSTSPTLSPYMSTTSLVPSAEPATAQSAHSYLQSLNISDKKKVKSRPDHASLFSQPEAEKGFFSGLSLKKNKDKETAMKEARQSWFSKLSRRTKTLMHQLLNTSENDKPDAPMKWESFLKVTCAPFWIYKYNN
jgi:methionine-rich copper-binding protein CopC